MVQRSLHWVAMLLTFALAAPGQANAAVLSASGSLELSIGSFNALTANRSQFDPLPIFVSSSGGGFVQPESMFDWSRTQVPSSIIPVLGAPWSLSANVGTGEFAQGGGSAGGFGGLGPLQAHLMSLLIHIPLDPVGRGGVATVGAAALMITVTADIWTTGRAEVTAVTSTTPNGFVNTVALTGFDARTAGHQGSLLLVTPFRLRLNSGALSGFASQSLYFVPEPGTVVLFMSGALGLVLVGRARH